jgi:hypothetical protein
MVIGLSQASAGGVIIEDTKELTLPGAANQLMDFRSFQKS